MLWKSQLQTIIVLSKTEAEYLALSTTLCTSIPVIRVLKKIGKNILGIFNFRAAIRINEDNESTICMDHSQRVPYWTKHIEKKITSLQTICA